MNGKNHIQLWIFQCPQYEVVLWNFENRWRHGGHGGDIFPRLIKVCFHAKFPFVSPKLYRRLSSDWKQSTTIFDWLVLVSFHSPVFSIAFEQDLYKDDAGSNLAPIADILLARHVILRREDCMLWVKKIAGRAKASIHTLTGVYECWNNSETPSATFNLLIWNLRYFATGISLGAQQDDSDKTLL